MTVIVTRHIEEHPSDIGGRLGRHVEHDERSRAYALSDDLLPGSYKTITHTINAPVLNQGNVGACTGFGTEACVSGDPFYATIPTTVKARPTANADTDNQQALALYSTATSLDNIRGTYPPDDTGSTGLAAAKAAAKAGLISGYQHALSLDAALKALGLVDVITGVNWYEGFDNPDANGKVTISGSVRGGHEFCVYGIDATKKLVWARNSWGADWGINGCFAFSWDDWGRLLDEQGDVTVFVPLTSPAPTPTPTPTPASVDAAMAKAARAWLTAKGL
ncbi:hypothetical protein ACFXKI_09510 [Streptomyces mirabilis]|uniref:hypothetical protein n=1 Tax=Streptomyces mirabilis TaxID=68239 RepID=UPI00368706DB